MKRFMQSVYVIGMSVVCVLVMSCGFSMESPFCLADGQYPGKSNVAHIGGVVLDGYDNAPVSGAFVTLSSTDNPSEWQSTNSPVYNVWSGADGAYTFGVVRDNSFFPAPYGYYYSYSSHLKPCITASKNGYIPSGDASIGNGTNATYLPTITNGCSIEYTLYLARSRSISVLATSNVDSSMFDVHDMASAGGIFWMTVRPYSNPWLAKLGTGLSSAATVMSNLYDGSYYYDIMAVATYGTAVVLSYAATYGSSSTLRYYNAATAGLLSNGTVNSVISALDYADGYFWAIVTNSVVQYSASWSVQSVLSISNYTIHGVCKDGNFVYCTFSRTVPDEHGILQYNWTTKQLAGKAVLSNATGLSGICTNGSGGFWVADNDSYTSKVYNVSLQ